LALIQDPETGFENFYPDTTALSDLLNRVKSGGLSLGMAKEVFEVMHQERRAAAGIIDERGLTQVSDEASLVAIVEKVIKDHPGQLEEFRSGKDKLFGFFMGQSQKELKGKGNPQTLKKILEDKLKT